MKDSDKVLVDTSAWIEFFRKQDPYYTTISDWMDEDTICCTGLIVAELLQGVKTEKEFGAIKDFLQVFDFLKEHKELWEKAGELSFNLGRKGYTIGLSDCYIAAAALENDAWILTLDKHFHLIKNAVDIHLVKL
ncbi:MAG: PIN domain-containing protein [Deltaproteobacteria bacterium]|nr:PIN domain-containing protein [Deltaproteobacteria bacterium]